MICNFSQALTPLVFKSLIFINFKFLLNFSIIIYYLISSCLPLFILFWRLVNYFLFPRRPQLACNIWTHQNLNEVRRLFILCCVWVGSRGPVVSVPKNPKEARERRGKQTSSRSKTAGKILPNNTWRWIADNADIVNSFCPWRLVCPGSNALALSDI